MASFVILLGSQEYGEETFGYRTLHEAKKEFKRLQRSCSEWYEEDGIYRILRLSAIYDEWNTNDIEVQSLEERLIEELLEEA
jgi:hypothetical protein